MAVKFNTHLRHCVVSLRKKEILVQPRKFKCHDMTEMESINAKKQGLAA